FAEERYWDVNTTSVGLGGTGVWDDTSPLWGTANGVAGPYVSWDNAALDDAFFQGVAGTVTLGVPITAHDLTFNANNYLLTGGTLTLGGVAPTITVVGSTLSTTIDSAIAGTSGLVKSGAGALHLGGVNTFSGGIALDGGSLFAATDAALGDPANAIVTPPGSAVRLSILGATPTARTVSIGTEGTLTLHGVAAGTAEITGDGNVVVDTGVTMDSDASTYTGTTTFRACNGVCTTYFTSIADLGLPSALGAPSTVENGTIVFNQSSQYRDYLVYLGTGHSSNRNWSLNGASAIIANQG